MGDVEVVPPATGGEENGVNSTSDKQEILREEQEKAAEGITEKVEGESASGGDESAEKNNGEVNGEKVAEDESGNACEKEEREGEDKEDDKKERGRLKMPKVGAFLRRLSKERKPKKSSSDLGDRESSPDPEESKEELEKGAEGNNESQAAEDEAGETEKLVTGGKTDEATQTTGGESLMSRLKTKMAPSKPLRNPFKRGDVVKPEEEAKKEAGEAQKDGEGKKDEEGETGETKDEDEEGKGAEMEKKLEKRLRMPRLFRGTGSYEVSGEEGEGLLGRMKMPRMFKRGEPGDAKKSEDPEAGVEMTEQKKEDEEEKGESSGEKANEKDEKEEDKEKLVVAEEEEEGKGKEKTATATPSRSFWHHVSLPSFPPALCSLFAKKQPVKEEEKGAEAQGEEEAKPGTDDHSEEIRLTIDTEDAGTGKNEGEGSGGDDKKKEGAAADKRTLLLGYWESFRSMSVQRKRIMFACLLLLLILIVIIIAVVCSLPAPRRWTNEDRIEGKYVNTLTSCGPVQGLVQSHGFTFYGIPYSITRMGRDRWKHSSTVHNVSSCWKGTLRADLRSVPCWQFYASGRYDGSENCLTLDIVTPKVTYDRPFPVVVLIATETLNGGLQEGLEPPTSLVKDKNIVFVKVNFRLGVLGFLSLRDISRNTNPPTSGNYGLSDIITALEWIHLNIRNFGGNPESVTLLGHLAGGTLVTSLTASLKTKARDLSISSQAYGGEPRLFHRAWVSGGAGAFMNQTPVESEAVNTIIRENTRCQSLRCLYDQTSEILLEAIPNSWIQSFYDLPPQDSDKLQRSWLIQDGEILTGTPTYLWGDEVFRNDVPMVFGATDHAEFRGWTDQANIVDRRVNSTEEMAELVRAKLSENFPEELIDGVIDRYINISESGGFEDLWARYFSLVTDVRTLCPLRDLARQASSQFQSQVYFYVASMLRNSTARQNYDLQVTDAYSDLEAMLGIYNITNEDQRLFVENMQSLFFNFVHDGAIIYRADYPRRTYLIGKQIRTVTEYGRCDYILDSEFFPRYARID